MNLHHAGVVDAELAGGIDQGQLGMRARDERAGRRAALIAPICSGR